MLVGIGATVVRKIIQPVQFAVKAVRKADVVVRKTTTVVREKITIVEGTGTPV